MAGGKASYSGTWTLWEGLHVCCIIYTWPSRGHHTMTSGSMYAGTNTDPYHVDVHIAQVHSTIYLCWEYVGPHKIGNWPLQ